MGKVYDYTGSMSQKEAEEVAKKTNQILEIIPKVSAQDIVNLVIVNELIK
jgi:hypothetical protein